MRQEEYFQKGLDIWEAAGKRYIPEEAVDEFRRAADMGHIKSMYYLGVYCEMQANDYVNPHPRAEYWLKKPRRRETRTPSFSWDIIMSAIPDVCLSRRAVMR